MSSEEAVNVSMSSIYILPSTSLTPGSGVVSIEQLSPVGVVSISHEDAIQPHLVRVGRRAMPETAGRSAWVAVVHAADGVCSDLVPFLASLLVPVEDVVPDAVVIEAVVCLVEGWDGAVLSHDQAIYARAVPIEQLVVTSAGDHGLIATVQSAAAVPAVSLGLVVVDDPRLCHARRICLSDASVIETAARNGGGHGCRSSERQAGESGRLHGKRLSVGQVALIPRNLSQATGSHPFFIPHRSRPSQRRAEEHFPSAKGRYGVSQFIHAC